MEPLKGHDPRQIGRYRLAARLGAGGMGQVFLGFSPAGRPVAVKVVHPELARDQAFLTRFQQEVAAARKVSGAYTAPVVDAGDGDRPWLATTLVAGPSLADAVERLGPLPEVSVWRLAAGLAEALAEVHACGLVHRDLKPSNVLLAADGPRIIDFGISRALDGAQLTGTGMVVGTPSYMSPEQASGAPVGPVTDVFSFGSVLAFAATGNGPFGDGTAAALIYRVVNSEPDLTGLPGALAALVSRCLAKRPEDRATFGELMEIITAKLDPVASASEFWPPALAEFIGSYQASFTAGWHPPTEVAAQEKREQEGTPGKDAAATITAAKAAPTGPAAASAPNGGQPGRRVRRPVRRLAWVGAAIAVVAAGAVLAMSLSSAPGPKAAHQVSDPQLAGAFGSIPAETGTPHAGTVSFAASGGTPDWILPVPLATTNYTGDVQQFDYLMWRPLYWDDSGASVTINPALSLAAAPVWSGGGTTVTITMNSRYKWSDGQPVTAQDAVFAIDLIKAAIAQSPQNWSYYAPGAFPADITAMTTPDARTLVLTLTAPVNQTWFDDDVLPDIQPMPAHVWARSSAKGALLDYGNPVDAKKIYDYLADLSSDQSTWAKNGIWQVVDGPFRLTSFNSRTGADTMAANPSYGGPDRGQIRALDEVTFGSDAAEFSALVAGRLDLGYLPPTDAGQASRVGARGYAVFGYPEFGYNWAVYNFKDTTGDFDHIVAQLYFRQVMAHVQDQPAYIRQFMAGAGGQDYGPVPTIPASQYASADTKTNPYPYSLAAARSLLSSHGWTVMPGGTDTCVRPGTGAGECGAGIPAGTRLAFNLVYDRTTLLTRQMVTALAAAARQAGIAITLQASTNNDILADDNDVAAPKNTDKWAMEASGGYTQMPYPTMYGDLTSNGSSNIGGYHDPRADQLMDASVSASSGGSASGAVTSEVAYLTAQQPALFEPNNDWIYAWTKTLSGPQSSFAGLTQFSFTPELWYFTR